MLWIYVAEFLLVISITIGFLSLCLLAMDEKVSDVLGAWTILWKIVLYILLPASVICLLQASNAMSSWAGPEVTIQLIIIFSLICTLVCAAGLTLLHGEAHGWLAARSRAVRTIAPFLICLWADGVASAIPYMVRSSAHDMGLADYRLPPPLAASSKNSSAGEVERLNCRHQLCEQAITLIPPGHVALPLIRVYTSPTGMAGQYAIALPLLADPRASPFEFSYIASKPNRDMGPIPHYKVAFYEKDRKCSCDIDESGTSEWINRDSISSEELRRLYVWAARKAAQDAKYWKERRTRPLEWAAIGVLDEVGYDAFKVQPANRQAELLDTILFWMKKLSQVAILGLLAKGVARAFKSDTRRDPSRIDTRSV